MIEASRSLCNSLHLSNRDNPKKCIGTILTKLGIRCISITMSIIPHFFVKIGVAKCSALEYGIITGSTLFEDTGTFKYVLNLYCVKRLLTSWSVPPSKIKSAFKQSHTSQIQSHSQQLVRSPVLICSLNHNLDRQGHVSNKGCELIPYSVFSLLKESRIC